MTLALAGIFKDSIVLGADTLTTCLGDSKNGAQDELSHKIEEYRGKFVFIFSGLKYIPYPDFESSMSINMVLRNQARDDQSEDPHVIFETLTKKLTDSFNKYFAEYPITTAFQLAMLGYSSRVPYYWFYDYDINQKGVIDQALTLKSPYTIIRCGGKNARREGFYQRPGRDAEYPRLSTKEGLKLIKRLLTEAYGRESASGYPPALNNSFDFAILTPGGFCWHTKQQFEECHLLNEAAKRVIEERE